MKSFLLLVCSCLFVSGIGLAQEKERHIFLLIGQSNMAGRAQIEDEDKAAIDGAFLWNIREKKWEAAAPPYNRHSISRKDMKMQRLNCGPSFAKAYLEANPGVELGIVCSARGGTKIEQWDREKPDKFNLYQHAIDATKEALANGGKLKGILWHQGEGNSTPEGIKNYPKRLKELVERLRKDLDSPSLPFVYSEVGGWKENYQDFNRMIVKQPAEIPNTGVSKTNGLKPFDSAHFNSAGQRELGKRYATEIQKLIAGKK